MSENTRNDLSYEVYKRLWDNERAHTAKLEAEIAQLESTLDALRTERTKAEAAWKSRLDAAKEMVRKACIFEMRAGPQPGLFLAARLHNLDLSKIGEKEEHK